MSGTPGKAAANLINAIDIQLRRQKAGQHLNAFISAVGQRPQFEQEVRDSMNRCDNDARISPLDGYLIAVKDNICTLDEPTTCASAILNRFKSPFSATVVEKLQGAGAFVTGKTNLDEFGMGSHSTNSHFGRVQSYICVDGKPLSAGGSSGGSAVAVSREHRKLALGTDTGGSVRLPAAYNGVFGFKPSYGLLSRWGVIAYANSLDTVGLMALDVPKLSYVFDILLTASTRDPTLVNSDRLAEGITDKDRHTHRRRFRIGVPKEYNTRELDPKIRRVWLECLQILHSHGHSIHSVSLPSTENALSAYYVIAAAEASSNLSKYDGVRYGNPSAIRSSGLASFAETRGSLLGEEVKRRILLGSYTLSAGAIDNHFIKAQKVRRLVQIDFSNVFRMANPLLNRHKGVANEDGVDFLLTPTVPTLPPTLDSLSSKRSVDTFADDVLTVPASLAGLPAISVPIPLTGSDPCVGPSLRHVGLQLIGQYGSDKNVLDMAKYLQSRLRSARSRQAAAADLKDCNTGEQN